MAWFLLGAALAKADEALTKRDDVPGSRWPREAEALAVETQALPAGAHRSEEGYKQRFEPSQGWVNVVPEHALRVTLRVSSPSGEVEATMHKNESHFVDVSFVPGSLGLGADWDSGQITAVNPGQAEQRGVMVGWVCHKVAGQPYSESLLDAKVAGTHPYIVTFALSQSLLVQSLHDEPFQLQIKASDSTRDVEEKIWRLCRICDANVAIELSSADGTQLSEDALVLEALPTFFYAVTLSVLRCLGDQEVDLLASTLGGGSLEMSVAVHALVQDVAINIHSEKGLQCDTTVVLAGSDGRLLATDKPVIEILPLLAFEAHA